MGYEQSGFTAPADIIAHLPNAAPVYPPETLPPPRSASGLVHLRDHVAAYFSYFDIPATVAPVGLKYRSFTLNQMSPSNANRVVFIPGEFEGELTPKNRSYGTLSRSTRNATSVVNPREIALWERPFTISVWSAPEPGNHANEEYAVAAVEDLLEQVIRACNCLSVAGQSASAALRWGDVSITAPPVENMFGVELLVNAILLSPFFDVTYPTVQATPSVGLGTYTSQE